ncbi:MAG: hypothetical protein U0K42_05330, partial [Bacteroidales bacterium]|nr:hypothetical protein [Bacteroidales bacterium]
MKVVVAVIPAKSVISGYPNITLQILRERMYGKIRDVLDIACICLKKVDSQKESIIMTPHTEFQKKYYQQVIEIHQKTGFSPRKIAKL